MAESIFDGLKSQIGTAATGQIARMLGLDESATGGILQQALAALLGGMMQKASTPGGAGGLLSLIQNSGIGGDVLNDLPNILGSPERTAQVEKAGGGFLGSLLGDKLGPIVDMIGKAAGVGSGKSSSLLSLLAPIVISYLVKNVLGKGLGVGGLMDTLRASAPDIKAFAPPGLTSALGVNSLADLGGDTFRAASDTGRAAADTARGVATDAARTTARAADDAGGLMKTLLPLLALALIGGALFFGLRGCQPEETPPVPEGPGTVGAGAPTVPPDPAARVGQPITDMTGAVGKMAAVELPGGGTLDLPAGGALADLVQNLKLPTPDFAKVYTLDFGADAAASPSPATRAGADALAKILQAIPGFGVSLNAYSDAPPNEAVERSQAIADGLKNLLVGAGAPADRVSAVGKGAAPTNKVELGITKL